MRVRITVMGAPWPQGAAVGDVVDVGERAGIPAWALGKCEPVADDEPVTAGAPSEASEPAPAASDVDALRAEAEALGVRVDRRWSAARLADEITKAKASP